MSLEWRYCTFLCYLSTSSSSTRDQLRYDVCTPIKITIERSRYRKLETCQNLSRIKFESWETRIASSFSVLSESPKRDQDLKSPAWSRKEKKCTGEHWYQWVCYFVSRETVLIWPSQNLEFQLRYRCLKLKRRALRWPIRIRRRGSTKQLSLKATRSDEGRSISVS